MRHLHLVLGSGDDDAFLHLAALRSVGFGWQDPQRCFCRRHLLVLAEAAAAAGNGSGIDLLPSWTSLDIEKAIAKMTTWTKLPAILARSSSAAFLLSIRVCFHYQHRTRGQPPVHVEGKEGENVDDHNNGNGSSRNGRNGNNIPVDEFSLFSTWTSSLSPEVAHLRAITTLCLPVTSFEDIRSLTPSMPSGQDRRRLPIATTLSGSTANMYKAIIRCKPSDILTPEDYATDSDDSDMVGLGWEDEDGNKGGESLILNTPLAQLVAYESNSDSDDYNSGSTR